MKKLLLFLVMLTLVLTACGNEEAEVDGEDIKLEEIRNLVKEEQTALTELEDEVESKEKKVLDLEIKFQDREVEFNELKDLSENRETLESEVTESKIKLDSTNSDITEAEAELKELNGEIVSLKDEPIKVGAGYFYFGEDIEPGRYRVETQNGRSGNVYVESSDGELIVSNNIGGDGKYSVDSYVFHASTGDELEAGVPILLYPVE